MHSRSVERWVIASNIVVFLLLAVVLLRPSGLIGHPVAEFMRERHERELLAKTWPALLSEASRAAGVDDSVRVIVEFIDYQCPYCRQMAGTLSRLAERNRIALLIRQFPLPSHEVAFSAARAALCAGRQERFADMHRQLLTTTEWERDSNWSREARAVGVADTAAFATCMSTEATREAVERDLALGAALNVGGTPTLYARQQRIEDATTIAQLYGTLR